MSDTSLSSTAEFDARGLVDRAFARVRPVLPRLKPAQRAIVERVIVRHAELRMEAIGASASRLRQIKTEMLGLDATLANFGDVLAARLSLAIRTAVIEAIRTAIDLVL
jgi:hypothetical protein